MTDQRTNSDQPALSTAQVLLGLFVVGQLFFLFAANLLPLLDAARPRLKGRRLVERLVPGWTRGGGHGHDAARVVTGLTSRWAQLSGQPQEWSLFAPNVEDRIPFVAVELRWDQEPPGAPGNAELLRSENEPADVNRFLRFGQFRLRRYEMAMDLALNLPEGKSADDMAAQWRGWVENHVRGKWRQIEAYLKWRVRLFLREHPERPPPRQAVLLVRIYLVPAPEANVRPWAWQLNSVQPLARWRPGDRVTPGYLPVEWYDHLFQRFEPLRQDE